MKRSLSIVFSGIVFTSVIAGALTISMLKLLPSKSAGSREGALPQAVVSANSTASASPAIVGTDHPVPVNPSLQVAASPKHKTPNPPSTPAPQVSALAENDSRYNAESPSELTRAKAEQARDQAERTRARVESLYQEHRISEAAYKQAQAEYQHELAKYGNQIARYRSTMTGTGAANE
ncbi:MAG TPA: hypothetical protein VIH58_10585 [Chthoniobacterales bacterium]|jgi:type IV secretory pathway VirB10-like protein